MNTPRFRRTAANGAAIFVADDFVSDIETDRLIAAAEAECAAQGGGRHDEAGQSCEVPVDGNDPVLETLRARIAAAFGFENRSGETMRFRRYAPGEFHPGHVDEYTIDGNDLVATAMLYLSEPEAGGATLFPATSPAPLLLEPRRARLAVWLNYRPDGTPENAAYHEALPVVRGHKLTLTNFIYAPAGSVPAFLDLPPEDGIPGVRFQPPSDLTGTAGAGPRFVCVDDGVPAITIALLRDACERRNIPFVPVETAGFAFHDTPALSPGDMLYRPATSLASSRVEQHLWAPGVAMFYTEPDGIFFGPANFHLLFRHAGVPIPRTFPIASADRFALRALVDAVGGFPVVLKVLGYSRGVGTMRVADYPALFSVADYLLAQGSAPAIAAFVDRAVHWRVTVVGARAVACYRNIQEDDDFRTYGSDDAADFSDTPPDHLAAVAIAAVRALRLEFGGVDVLEAPDGQLYVLEANFPCYFGQAQVVAGIDVAGAMVAHLMAKSRAILTAAPNPDGPTLARATA